MNTKDRFYSIISKYDIDVFNFSEKIEDFRCFSDTTHINYEGAKIFTKYINEILN